MDLDRAGRKFHHFAVARQIVGALAADLHGGEARRHLFDETAEAGNERADGLGSRAFRAGLGGAAFGVVGIALLAPPHGETVDLAPVHDERHRLGCFSERDGQQAGCQRIKRAGMAGALGLQQTLDHAHGMGRGHAYRLVEHEPAIHVALLALRLILRFWFFCNDLGQLSSSVLLLRSRWTCGVRSSFSIRSASSKRWSMRKRISGANFKLTWCAISPRRKRLLRSNAASTASVSRPPSGIR